MLQWAGDACVISWEHLHWEGRERKSTLWSCSRIQNQHLSSLQSSLSWAPMSPKPNTSAATKQILKKIRTKQKPTANQQQNNLDIKSESWLKVNLKSNSYFWLYVILIIINWNWEAEYVWYSIFFVLQEESVFLFCFVMCVCVLGIWGWDGLSKLIPCRHCTWMLFPAYLHTHPWGFMSK